MISHEHKFIFIQPKKTATSTLHGVLFRYMVVDYSKISRHAKYSEALELYPESKNYFKFCFVRNPWDRIVSFYFFKKDGLATVKIPKDMSFKQFVNLVITEHKITMPDQYGHIEGFDNFSFIGRFENLQQDFNFVCDKIGIQRQQLLHDNKTKHKHYTEYYDDETREIVAEKYARDIEYFGYKFGE